MAYNTMKKLITNANVKYEQGSWDAEQYEAYKESQQRKLDVFFAAGRITEPQYEELTHLWVSTDPEG